MDRKKRGRETMFARKIQLIVAHDLSVDDRGSQIQAGLVSPGLLDGLVLHVCGSSPLVCLKMSTIVNQVDDRSRAITTAAVEEQHVTTNDISSTISEVSQSGTFEKIWLKSPDLLSA